MIDIWNWITLIGTIAGVISLFITCLNYMKIKSVSESVKETKKQLLDNQTAEALKQQLAEIDPDSISYENVRKIRGLLKRMEDDPLFVNHSGRIGKMLYRIHIYADYFKNQDHTKESNLHEIVQDAYILIDSCIKVFEQDSKLM